VLEVVVVQSVRILTFYFSKLTTLSKSVRIILLLKFVAF